nr:copper-binding protein [Ramlibacter sp. Leaf400]
MRKVDWQNRKVTLRHGAIRNLEMPAMTMAFEVADAGMLDRLKAGDKVLFAASAEGGRYTVTQIQPVR